MTVGPGVITQRCQAQSNFLAQYYDTPASTGVIHFRNIAGNSRATAPPAGAGAGFLVDGTGNRISSSTVTKNAGLGVHLLGSGNQLHRSSVSQNVGAQVQVSGDWNFIVSVSATRVSTGAFTSVAPAYNVLAGSQYNFFKRNRASVAGTTVGDGYTIPDATSSGERNTRRPVAAGDPPAALQ
jgi:parallel beta-helix repeat protein